MTKADRVDNKVLGKSILIAGITIAVMLIIWEIVYRRFFPEVNSWSTGVKTAVAGHTVGDYRTTWMTGSIAARTVPGSTVVKHGIASLYFQTDDFIIINTQLPGGQS